MKNIIGHIVRALREVLPAFIFFLIMFHILVITKSLTLREYGIMAPASAVAVISALIVAKVILITGRLPFLNLYPKKPLIWNVVLKTIVFTLVTVLFLFAEELVHQTRKAGSFDVAVRYFGDNIIWPVFWARVIWVVVLIFFYCSAGELVRVIGVPKVREIFFGVK